MSRVRSLGVLLIAGPLAGSCSRPARPVENPDVTEVTVPEAGPVEPTASVQDSAEERDARSAPRRAVVARSERETHALEKCCRALGRAGFGQRRHEYLNAAQLCEESLTKNDRLADALPHITALVGSYPLPRPCRQEDSDADAPLHP